MKKIKISKVVVELCLILLCLFCIVPFALLVISSLTDEQSLILNGYSFLPKEWSLYAYKYLLAGGSSKILRGYVVSAVVTIGGTAISLVITSLYAYAISIKELPFRKIFTFILFFTMLFNGGLVPSYMMWTQIFHIKNSLAALILPNLLLNAYFVIMMRTYYMNSIPKGLLEAARIDGASELKVLIAVVTPLSKPMFATVGFMTALNYWNDWLNGLYYETDTKYFGIQNILNRMMMDSQFLANSQSAGDITSLSSASIPSKGILMAIAVIALIPVLIIYPFMQKYLVKGITIGGLKG
jgi:putative aldouronate transport system permease protein